ncbi:TPA: hypothetical protein H1012_00100 [archaeon]|nr:hypothetical protein [Candidatus Naiadarchaeales archaeon SRR2090153.bin461]HIK02232.1 hypothetical protein [Candidatus Naiadarchaeales archaeon SRR2090159.bin1288]
MGLFDKKKIPPGKNVPLGPPNLDKMEDEGLEGIKGEVGFPEESHDELAEDFPEEQQEYSGFGESETAETAETAETEPTNEGEELAPPPHQYPDFLPPPPGLPIEPPAGASSAEELKQALRDIVNEIRGDFDQKLETMNAELEQIKVIENSLEILTEDVEKLGKKYDALEQKLSVSQTEDMAQMKNTINEINQIMKTALPALIREVRDIKTSKYLA